MRMKAIKLKEKTYIWIELKFESNLKYFNSIFGKATRIFLDNIFIFEYLNTVTGIFYKHLIFAIFALP